MMVISIPIDRGPRLRLVTTIEGTAQMLLD
jgi:hypothetical protein